LEKNVCHADCSHCKTDIILMKGSPVGLGLRRCSFCGFEWTLKAGELDNCPQCGHPYVIEGRIAEGPSVTPGPAKYLHAKIAIVKDSTENLKPEEVLEKSRQIFKQMRTPDAVKLTVGDHSVVEQNKEKYRSRDTKRYLRNHEQKLSVGDLSVATESKDSVDSEMQRARAERDSLTVGSKFVGHPTIIEPAVSESQEILMNMQECHRNGWEYERKIRAHIFEKQEEDKARSRRAHEQIDREVAELRREAAR
jgi:DNA-directed RNA polymerase subunit RPC12/RpoP